MKRLLANPFIALAAGLALRLYFVLRFPATSGDAALYEQFAENWLKHGVYGMFINGRLVPVDMRMPGYPAFLAVTYLIAGHSGAAARLWVMLGQVAVDLATCILIVILAVLISPEATEYPTRLKPERLKLDRLKLRTLWLAATCPFIANYAAVPLTEVFSASLTAAVLIFVVLQVRSAVSVMVFLPPSWRRFGSFTARHAFEIPGILAGFLTGLGTLFRPEMPLLLFTSWIVLAWVLARRGEIVRGIRTALLAGLAFLVPLAPWAVRNAVTLHEVQFLAPRYSQLPGEFVPRGFMAWEKTWLYRLRDVYGVSWKLNGEPILMEDIPERAFDTPEEKGRIAAVLDEYNDSMTLTAKEDAEFAAIARERTARHPLRTCVKVPLARAVTIWFTPRIELLPFSGNVFPLAQTWEDDPVDQSVTSGFFLLNVFYVGLALWGAVRLWRGSLAARPAIAVLLGYLVLRTAFLTTLETPEPRYVVVCFPIILALAAQVFSGSPAPATTRPTV